MAKAERCLSLRCITKFSTFTVCHQAWAAGPVFKRESRLEQYGLMVRQEYDENGAVTCSLVADISGQSRSNSKVLFY